jgi:hypothetical protein
MSGNWQLMSALLPKAAIYGQSIDVSKVPFPDIYGLFRLRFADIMRGGLDRVVYQGD